MTNSNSIFKRPDSLRCLLRTLLCLAAGVGSTLQGQETNVEPTISEGSYSFVVLPDTQYYYADQGSGNFGKWLAQMNWIRDHAESHNIRYVLHLGDITDQADHSSTHLNQWNSARAVCAGIIDKVPLALALGNHDGLENSRTTLFSNPEYFGAGSAYANQPTLIETMDPERWENSVHRLEIEGRSWLILAVEWGPRDAVVAWADDVLNRFPNDTVILILHAYLFRDSSRFDWALLGDQDSNDRQRGNPIGYGALTGDPEGVNDGQKLWNKLIRNHSNVKLVLNGHVGRSGHGRRVAIGKDRQYVHQHLSNFQHWTGDGNGRMRLMEVNPASDTITVSSFSPYSDEILEGPDLDFTFSLSSRSLKTHYRKALRELDPVAVFQLGGEDTSRPLISQFPTWELAQAEGFGNDESQFGSGRRIHYPSSAPAADTWTALLWFHSDDEQETLPVLQLGTEFTEILSVLADTSSFAGLPLDATHTRSDFDEESGLLTVKMEPSQWHHLVLRSEGGKLTTILDGDVVSTADFPGSGIRRFTLGDFTEGSVETDVDWRILDFSYHARALSIPEIEWLWRSAFCQTISSEVILHDGQDALPSIQTDGDSYPGFALRAEIDGELLFGTAEPSIYRIQDNPGASRDPHSRYLRSPRTLEYSEGILLATPVVSNLAEPVGIPPVQWKTLNRTEGTYFGSTYAPTQMSVLNISLPIPYDGSVKQLNSTFFPFASDWKGGYVKETGGYLYGQEDVIENVVVTHLGDGAYRLTPPEDWNQLTLLGQSSVQNTRLSVQPFEGNWDLVLLTGDPQPASENVPFSFIFLPQDADGVRSGWFDPTVPAGESSFWQVTDTGSYLFTAPTEGGAKGLLQITPGTTIEGEIPLMKLYASEGSAQVLEFEVDGGSVDAPFAWAWVAPEPDQPEKDTAVDVRVLESLEDSVYGDFGWYYTERLSWIYAGADDWPWVWSPHSGWLYLFPSDPPSEGLWFFSWDSGAYLYVTREYRYWAYSTLEGWIPWNRGTD